MGAKRLPVKTLPLNIETGSEEPVSKEEFAALMEAFAPFEAAPHIAVAVSGGPDSMGLCLLCDRWARDRGGWVTALSVDHGLRAASAEEALRVGRWMERLGIAHQTLVWPGDKPSSGIQAAARTARYKLMNGWCRDAGVLHLLLAHHRRDQAETFLMRLGRGSGPDGLAAMPAMTGTGSG
ncbi:MAG TPA: tRNA lysidine(34) synthetase TilS, partial [Rhodospirillales bacterium]|nr:tRNA lysidine(34) synthetase TilS [Rhodospirillales bacterium]